MRAALLALRFGSSFSAFAFACAAPLMGCGAAATGATPPPSHPEVEVVVPVTDAPKETSKDAASKRNEGDAVARLGGDKSADELLDLLNGKDAPVGVLSGTGSGGVVGGVVGGMVSGLGGLGSLGVGGGGTGLGLSGTGISAGGFGGGIGLGSIGTIGRGSGGGYGSGYGSFALVNPVPGTAIHASARSIVAMGDVVTFGLSPEDAARALRNNVDMMHRCYETKGLDVSKLAAGDMDLRLVVGRDGKITYVTSTSQQPSRAVVKCIADELVKAYVATPAAGAFGSIEITIAFSPKK
ncbi:MAG: hypothetical protein U0441_21750 [Polyangiaceae bacterium]